MSFLRGAILALNQADVRYVVVGGVAVVLQGHIRSTVDLDLVVDLEPSEARKAIETLLGLGLSPTVPVDPLGFADPDVRSGWIKEKNMLVFQLRHPDDIYGRVDLFVSHPIDFSDLWERSELLPLEGMSVRVASIPDLVDMKRVAGRPVDEMDIQALEIILDERQRG